MVDQITMSSYCSSSNKRCAANACHTNQPMPVGHMLRARYETLEGAADFAALQSELASQLAFQCDHDAS